MLNSKNHIIKISEISERKYSLSSQTYNSYNLKNKNFEYLDKLIFKPIRGSDQEEINYLNTSPFIYLKTKGIESNNFIINTDDKSCFEYLHPKAFFKSINKNRSLIEGDLIYTSSGGDSIGEASIVNNLGGNIVYSSHIFKIIPKDNHLKFYILAFLKSDFCKNELGTLVYRGATLRRGGDKFLKLRIPFPNSNKNEIISFISDLVLSVINKENKIKEKSKIINSIIDVELNTNQLPNQFVFRHSKYFESYQTSRLDTGTYSNEFKTIEFLIRNYKNGIFYINKKNIASGNTPTQRIIDSNTQLKYKWITPTNISDFGYFIGSDRILFKNKKNNLNKNAMLVINRTSKGGLGEYVGISAFYDYNIYGVGHHNQGIYQVTGYTDYQLKFMACFMNSPLLRKYCAGLSVGSKMKELKTNHILSIPFPNFPENKIIEIANLYHNSDVKMNDELNLDNFTQFDFDFNNKAGIIQLEQQITKIKIHLNKTLENIINDENVKIDFDFLNT